jgi:hypothetical protein
MEKQHRQDVPSSEGEMRRHHLLCMGGSLEGTEDTVSDDLSARPRQYREVKPGSPRLRFVIANNSSTRFAKSDLASGPRETCDKTACHYSALFSPAPLSEKILQSAGNFICFVGDSVIFLYGGD